MRALRRKFRRVLSEFQISGRRREVEQEIGKALGLGAGAYLHGREGMGHDSIYFLTSGSEILGVLRLLNPYKKRPSPKHDQPFLIEDGQSRIEREWRAYERGAACGLTPRPLWRSADALLCEYLPYETVFNRVTQDVANCWTHMMLATRAIASLHRAGLVHMDASLSNILWDNNRLAFIDFEYAPNPSLSLSEQKAYDHLRIVESAWKFLPSSARGQFSEWLAHLDSVAGRELRNVDLRRLQPGLGRIMGDEQFGPAIRKLCMAEAVAA